MITPEVAFARYRAELVRYIARRTGSAQSAEDIAQEMFLRFMQSRQSNDIREPAAYLRVIASHVMYEQRQRQAREPVVFDSALADAAASHVPATTVHGRIDLQQRAAAVLKRLPRLHAAIVVLRHRDGLSREDIAQRLSISPHTVKQYLRLALKRCRTIRGAV